MEQRTLGIIGGTGPQGRGLGVRWARAGHTVLLGSRDADRAEQAVGRLGQRAAGTDLRGVTNAQACADADLVVVAVPYDAQAPTIRPLADAVRGKVVVSCVNALAFDDRGPVPVPVEAGSAAEECQRLLPGARVVSAFHEVSAHRLLRVDEPVTVDVLVCGDDDEAKAEVLRLAAVIPGMRGVDCGPLRLSATVEALTAVLLSINKRHGTHAGIRVDGLPREAD